MKEITNGIAERLRQIKGLRVFSTEEIPDSINQFPAAIVMPGITEYSTTFSEDADYNFRIILFFSKADSPSAIKDMLPYIRATGDKSIAAAMEADVTLDGSAETSRIARNLGIGSTQWGGGIYLSTEFIAQVWANKS